MKDVQHIPAGAFPCDFELDGGNLNLEVKGGKLWICFNGECLIRVRGFDEFSIDGEKLNHKHEALLKSVKSFLCDGLDEPVKNDLWNEMIDLGYGDLLEGE